jgi:hypothetical protein
MSPWIEGDYYNGQKIGYRLVFHGKNPLVIKFSYEFERLFLA